MAASSPFAVYLLGVESLHRDRQSEQVERQTSITAPAEPATSTMTAPTSRPSRPAPRRATSYHNTFQTICSPATDEPPSYALAAKRPSLSSASRPAKDSLPAYTCSITAEARLLLHLESTNPLHNPTEDEWREVYVVLRGTMLNIHRFKDGGAGRLLRSYTLQHAEVGLATDAQHAVLEPQTRLAHLIPSSARQKAWKKDARLFRCIRQHILRIRVETDQFLLADASEERVHAWIFALSAGIDISHAIDERSTPRQCTVPRRRRQRQPRTSISRGLDDPTLLAEQERILRDMYPAFAERTAQTPADGGEQRVAPTTLETVAETTQTPSREEDEVDFSMIREENTAAATTSTASAQRANSTNSSDSSSQTTSTTATTLTFNDDMMYATSRRNFDSTSGKWQPPHARTAQQAQRYVRRCMPVLLADATRASDVLIAHGRRVKINWRMQMLEDWELRPPSYKAHGFETDAGNVHRARSVSQLSTAESASAVAAAAQQQGREAQTTSSVLVMAGDNDVGSDSDDQITPADETAALGALDLSKVVTNDKPPTTPLEAPASLGKTRERGDAAHAHTHANGDVHGILFCF